MTREDLIEKLESIGWYMADEEQLLSHDWTPVWTGESMFFDYEDGAYLSLNLGLDSNVWAIRFWAERKSRYSSASKVFMSLDKVWEYIEED